MNRFAFALRRLLRTPAFLILLVLSFALPLLAFRAGTEVAAPPAGYHVPEPADEDSVRLAALLQEAGFERFDSEEALSLAVSEGLADAGVSVPGDLSRKLSAGETEEILLFYKAPTSLQPDLWQEHAAAALFTVYAPYISAACLKDSGLTQEAVRNAYYEMQAEGSLFRFALETVEGRLNVNTERSRRFFKGALSLLLFTAVFFGVYEPLMKDVRLQAPRIGYAAAYRQLLLPGAALRLLLLFAAATAALLACDSGLSPLTVLFHLLFLAGLSLILVLLPGRLWQSILAALLTVLSLAGCPVYADLSASFPVVEKLRLFLPAYFLWITEEKWLIGLYAAVLALIFHYAGIFSDVCSQFIQKSCKKFLH